MKTKKRTTHKIVTNVTHIACGLISLFILFVWAFGNKYLDVTVMDAPQMLQYVAWVEIINLAQYSAKSSFDHKHGIFDNPVVQAAVSGMAGGDIAFGAKQVVDAITQTDGQPPDDNGGTNNNNMAG